jgi:Tripartite tricarboxylate transporter TctB family
MTTSAGSSAADSGPGPEPDSGSGSGSVEAEVVEADARLPVFYARTNVITAGVFLILGVALLVVGLSYGLFRSNSQPGPGLFPTILGALMCGLSVLWLLIPAQRDVTTADSDLAIPDRRGLVYILTTLVAGAGFIFALEPLGYQLTMLIYMIVLLRFVSHHRWIVAVPMAFAFSFGSFFLFVSVLGVQLPAAGIPFLKGLGL